MSASATVLDSGGHVSGTRSVKMELLRALVTQRLSAAADEIFSIVERTMMEYEKEMSCSQWVVDSHRRLLDVARPRSEDSVQMSATDVKLQSALQQPAATVNVSVCWEEPENPRPDSSPAADSDQSDQILIDLEDLKQECDLDMPLKIPKVKKPFKCPVCLSGFSSKKTMVRHFKKHPEDNSALYQCQFCDRYFHHKSDFIIHARTHKGTKPHTCQDCEKSFDERESLLIHRQTHVEEKPYVCSKVEEETDLRSVTPDRKMEELASGTKTFPLTITPYDKSEFDQESLQPLCLYQIQTVADIDNHIKTEPGVSDTDDHMILSVNPRGESETVPKHVNTVRRASGNPPELQVEFEAGTAQKPYKCPCCSKCFSLTKTLIRHARIHTEDRQYQCPFCGRNFCQKSDLVNHTRIHTGERPYQCNECHKSFAQKGNLVVHMRKHTGSKVYQCQDCSCSFTQRSAFHGHMQSHR